MSIRTHNGNNYSRSVLANDLLVSYDAGREGQSYINGNVLLFFILDIIILSVSINSYKGI